MSRRSFRLVPLPPFRLDLTVWALRRRSHNLVDRWDGTTYRRVLRLPRGPVEVAVTQPAPHENARLEVAVTGQPVTTAVRTAVTTALERLLGLHVDLTEFYEFAARDRRLGPLAQRFRGMKPPRFATVFESVVNAMACQQLSLTLGIHLLNRTAGTFGAAIGESGQTVHAFPRPEDLVGASPSVLRELGYSRQKGRAMIELSRAVAEDGLDLEQLQVLPDGAAVARLLDLRGVGRWTAEYVLLRGLGRLHVFPGDDVGAQKSLQRWLQLQGPLDYVGVGRILERWKQYGGLIYLHLLLAGLAGENLLEAPASPPSMIEADSLTVWTIGHSTRTMDEFIDLLRRHRIEVLVDVRHYPGSRHVPHFNRSALQHALAAAKIRYEHLVDLGGRRSPRPNSINLNWRNASLRGYADYMETRPFRKGIERLLEIARGRRTAIMCAEAVWWRCHRSLIADDLKAMHVQVLHILGSDRVQAHPYTSAARLVDGRLTYESALLTPDSHSLEVSPMKSGFKIGDHVEWNSEAGRVRGTIRKRITSRIKFKGYTVRASKEEPQYLIKSDKTDHLAMHKGSALKKIRKANR